MAENKANLVGKKTWVHPPLGDINRAMSFPLFKRLRMDTTPMAHTTTLITVIKETVEKINSK